MTTYPNGQQRKIIHLNLERDNTMTGYDTHILELYAPINISGIEIGKQLKYVSERVRRHRQPSAELLAGLLTANTGWDCRIIKPDIYFTIEKEV